MRITIVERSESLRFERLFPKLELPHRHDWSLNLVICLLIRSCTKFPIHKPSASGQVLITGRTDHVLLIIKNVGSSVRNLCVKRSDIVLLKGHHICKINQPIGEMSSQEHFTSEQARETNVFMPNLVEPIRAASGRRWIWMFPKYSI